MELSEKKLQSQPKVIGKIRDTGEPVVSIRTKGGLECIIGMIKGKTSTLGMGPHIALAKYLAAKKSKIDWTELSKSDPMETLSFKDDIGKWEKALDEIRSKE